MAGARAACVFVDYCAAKRAEGGCQQVAYACVNLAITSAITALPYQESANAKPARPGCCEALLVGTGAWVPVADLDERAPEAAADAAMLARPGGYAVHSSAADCLPIVFATIPATRWPPRTQVGAALASGVSARRCCHALSPEA